MWETPCTKQGSFFPPLLFRGGKKKSSVWFLHLRSHMIKKTQKHSFLPHMRVVEWPGASGFFIFLSGFGPSGNVDESLSICRGTLKGRLASPCLLEGLHLNGICNLCVLWNYTLEALRSPLALCVGGKGVVVKGRIQHWLAKMGEAERLWKGFWGQYGQTWGKEHWKWRCQALTSSAICSEK